MSLALKFATGFENGLASGDAEGVLTSLNGITVGAARSGDYGLDLDANDIFVLDDIVLDMTNAFYVGFAFKYTGLATASVAICSMTAAGLSTFVNFYYDRDSNRLSLGPASSVIGTPTVATRKGVGAVKPNFWHYIEIGIYIHDSAGAMLVRFDGVEVVNVTGIDTQNLGTAPTTEDLRIQFGGSSPADMYLDDVVVAEASSTTPELFGEVGIHVGRPTSAVVSDMTGSDANQVDNHLLVDESPPDTADYVESSTIGHQDTYGTDAAVPAGSTVKAVKVAAYALMDDAGPKGMGLFVKEGATEATSSAVALTETAAIISNIWETNPDTATAWTVTEANAAEIGVEIVS